MGLGLGLGLLRLGLRLGLGLAAAAADHELEVDALGRAAGGSEGRRTAVREVQMRAREEALEKLMAWNERGRGEALEELMDVSLFDGAKQREGQFIGKENKQLWVFPEAFYST